MGIPKLQKRFGRLKTLLYLRRTFKNTDMENQNQQPQDNGFVAIVQLICGLVALWAGIQAFTAL